MRGGRAAATFCPVQVQSEVGAARPPPPGWIVDLKWGKQRAQGKIRKVRRDGPTARPFIKKQDVTRATGRGTVFRARLPAKSFSLTNPDRFTNAFHTHCRFPHGTTDPNRATAPGYLLTRVFSRPSPRHTAPDILYVIDKHSQHTSVPKAPGLQVVSIRPSSVNSKNRS